MSEKEVRRYEGIFARTLDEVAERLQVATNKLIKEGYAVQVEAKAMPASLEGFGYMVHAQLEDPVSEGPQFAVLPPAVANMLRQQLLNGDDSKKEGVSEKTDKFLESIFSRVSSPDWEVVEKEIPAIVPMLLQGYTASDIETMRADLEKALDRHAERHEGDVKACPFHRGVTLLMTLLKDNVRLHMQ